MQEAPTIHHLLGRRIQLVEALRSGRYRQAQKRLRVGSNFCCLGVACDIYGQYASGALSGQLAVWTQRPTDGSLPNEEAPIFHFVVMKSDGGILQPGANVEVLTNEGATLPYIVSEFYGFDSENPLLPREILTRDWSRVSLTGLNDNGFTFDQIADLIEYFFVEPLRREVAAI